MYCRPLHVRAQRETGVAGSGSVFTGVNASGKPGLANVFNGGRCGIVFRGRGLETTMNTLHVIQHETIDAVARPDRLRQWRT